MIMNNVVFKVFVEQCKHEQAMVEKKKCAIVVKECPEMFLSFFGCYRSRLVYTVAFEPRSKYSRTLPL